MEKYFNVAGPCFPEEHYMLPALDRMPGIRRLVARRQYFVVHAPRQDERLVASGATSDARQDVLDVGVVRLAGDDGVDAEADA